MLYLLHYFDTKYIIDIITVTRCTCTDHSYNRQQSLFWVTKLKLVQVFCQQTIIATEHETHQLWHDTKINVLHKRWIRFACVNHNPSTTTQLSSYIKITRPQKCLLSNKKKKNSFYIIRSVINFWKT